MLELLLGQVPEAIYFALFMIFTKEIKEKRLIFILGMILEYLLVMNILPYSIWSHIGYFILSFLLLKVLYKRETHIIDVFMLGIASLFMIVSSGMLYTLIYFTIRNMVVYVLLHRVILLISLILYKNKLPKLNKLYKKLWNRKTNSYKMKSTTFRALNLTIFNLSFVLINLGIIFYYCWR